MANIIFSFVSNAYLRQHHLVLEWCVFTYSICFILETVNFMVNQSDWDKKKKLPIHVPHFLPGQSIPPSSCTPLLLSSGRSKSSGKSWVGRQTQCSSDVSCSDQLTTYVCIWDQQLAMNILTGIHLLIYVAHVACLAKRLL